MWKNYFGLNISVFVLILFYVRENAGLPILADNSKCGIILDAGSSSTKIRIYTWQDTIETVPYFEEYFYSKVKPGVSSFHENIEEITTYLRSILEILQGQLPEEVWSTTPLYFMATAGKKVFPDKLFTIIFKIGKKYQCVQYSQYISKYL